MLKLTSLLLLLNFLFSAVLYATEKNEPPLVLLSGEWQPYVGERLVDQGFITELVKAVFEKMERKVSVKWLPWVRGEQAVLKGEYFATFPYANSAERDPLFLFSDPLFYTQTVFFYNTKFNRNIKFEQWSDLKGYRIGGVRGYGYVPSIQKRGLNLHLVNTPKQLVKMLLRNRVDLIAINLTAGWEMIDRHYQANYNEFATLEKKVNSKHSIHLMISKKYPGALALKAEFNQALSEIKSQGIYDIIMQQKLLSRYRAK